MILTQVVYDAPIVCMNAEHLTKKTRLRMGDSVGHWEGDTLVVDTTNFTDKTRFRESTENLHVIERFTPTSDPTLLYRFTLESPNISERPWTGEISWPSTIRHRLRSSAWSPAHRRGRLATARSVRRRGDRRRRRALRTDCILGSCRRSKNNKSVMRW